MQALVRAGRRSLTQSAALSRLLGSSAPTLADAPTPAEQHAAASEDKYSPIVRDFQVYRYAGIYLEPFAAAYLQSTQNHVHETTSRIVC